MHLMATSQQSIFGDMNVAVPLYLQTHDSSISQPLKLLRYLCSYCGFFLPYVKWAAGILIFRLDSLNW